MSYSRRPQQKSPRFVPVEGTLFDEAFLDDVAAEAGSREAAYAELGLQAPEVPVEPKADIIRRSLAERAVKAVQSEVDSFTTPESGDASIEKTNLARPEKMKVLFELYHFYPRNPDEQSSMFSILDNTSINPAVGYLASVIQSQKRHGVEDPFAAARSIARKMQAYALESDAEAKRAHVVGDSIKDRSTDLEQPFSEVYTLDDIRYDTDAKPTYTTIVRRIEADLFSEDEVGDYPLGKRSGVDAMKPRLQDEYIFDTLKAMSLETVINLSERVCAEEILRFEYWRTQLKSLMLWRALDSQATESVKVLNKKRPEKEDTPKN